MTNIFFPQNVCELGSFSPSPPHQVCGNPTTSGNVKWEKSAPLNVVEQTEAVCPGSVDSIHGPCNLFTMPWILCRPPAPPPLHLLCIPWIHGPNNPLTIPWIAPTTPQTCIPCTRWGAMALTWTSVSIVAGYTKTAFCWPSMSMVESPRCLLMLLWWLMPSLTPTSSLTWPASTSTPSGNLVYAMISCGSLVSLSVLSLLIHIALSPSSLVASLDASFWFHVFLFFSTEFPFWGLIKYYCIDRRTEKERKTSLQTYAFSCVQGKEAWLVPTGFFFASLSGNCCCITWSWLGLSSILSRSVVSYRVTELPLFSQEQVAKSEKITIYDSIDEDVLRSYNEFALTSLVYYTMKEGACSEQSSRMTAMDSASKNAGKWLGVGLGCGCCQQKRW